MAATLDASLRLDSSQFTSGLSESMRRTNAAVSQMSSAFSMLKNIAIGGAVGSAFATVAKEITTTYIEAEKLQNALKATAGNEVLGMSQYEQLKTLSAEIGVNMSIAAKATLQLQAAGMASADAFKIIRTFQNAVSSSGGGSEELGRLLYGFKQLYGSTKPVQEDINQINEALDAAPFLFKKAFGSDRSEDLQKLKLSGQQVAEALVKTAEGMPKLGRGLGGQIDAIKAKFESLKEMAGEESSGTTKGLAGGLSSFLDYIIKRRKEMKAASEAFSMQAAGIDPAKESEKQAVEIKAAEAKKKAEFDKLKAAQELKKLQEALDKGNKENAELDAIRWQNEEKFQKEQDDKKEKARQEADKANVKAIDDARKLFEESESAMRKMQGIRETIYGFQQDITKTDEDRLANAKKALSEEGNIFGAEGEQGAENFKKQFEEIAKSGKEISDDQIEKYNRIIDLKQEIFNLEESITEEAKNGKAALRDQNREAVQRSIDKAGMTPAQRKQEIRDQNDMKRQRKRAFDDDVRDEMTRLKKEAEKANLDKPIMERERTDREAFREAAKANITKKWQSALPEAAATLVDIKTILDKLATA